PAARGLGHDQQAATALGVEVRTVTDGGQLRVVVADRHPQGVRRPVHLDGCRGAAVDDRVGDQLANQQRGVLAQRRRKLGRRAEVTDELPSLLSGGRTRREAQLGLDVELGTLAHATAPLGPLCPVTGGLPDAYLPKLATSEGLLGRLVSRVVDRVDGRRTRRRGLALGLLVLVGLGLARLAALLALLTHRCSMLHARAERE